MGEVLLVNVEPNTAELLFALQPIPELRSVQDPEMVKQELTRRPRAVELLVLGASRGDPIRVAEDARGIDQDLSIVILAEPSRLEQIVRRVMYAPFLSGDVTCQSIAENASIGPVLNEAMTRTRQRRKHHDDVVASLSKLEAPKVWQPNPKQYLDRLLDHAPIGVAVLDYSGEIRAWNRRAATVFGAPEETVIGARLTEFFHPSDRERLGDFLSHSAAKGDELPPQIFRGQRAPDDEPRQLEVTAATISSRSGEPGALVLFKDVTQEKEQEAERQRIETQMQRAQKLESLGVLAGGIAHDFNNLLVGVVGNADLALLLAPAGSPIQKALIKIKMAGGRASELTQQLLAYSGKTKGGRIETIDLNPLVSELKNLLEVSISNYVSLDMVLSADLPLVRGDLSQITQVLMNLITNASEAIGERPGSIMITTGTVVLGSEECAQWRTSWDVSEGVHVFIDVSDTGCGMSASTCQQIFEPFFTTKSTGRGLGLAAVAGIIRSHHGAIEVDSELDVGTTFRVLLPAAPGAQLEAPPPDAIKEGHGEGEGTILAVDDEEEVRAVLSEMLQTFGFEVETAGDGVEAIDIFRESPDSFCAVILDMAMPRMGGAETLRALREIRSDIPIIICTGYNEDHAVEGSGPSPFLHKPFRLATLMTKLEEALGRSFSAP